MGKKIAYVSAALLSLFVLVLLIILCKFLTETFVDFPGDSMTKPINFNSRSFDQTFDGASPLYEYQQFTTPSMKGTSLKTIDSLTTGRFPISIDWGKNWYNVP